MFFRQPETAFNKKIPNQMGIFILQPKQLFIAFGNSTPVV